MGKTASKLKPLILTWALPDGNDTGISTLAHYSSDMADFSLSFGHCAFTPK